MYNLSFARKIVMTLIPPQGCIHSIHPSIEINNNNNNILYMYELGCGSGSVVGISLYCITVE